MVELVAHGAGVADPGRPVHDQRHVDTAFVGVLLVPAERRVARLRPTPRVVGMAVRPADVVEAFDRLAQVDEVAMLVCVGQHFSTDLERVANDGRAVVVLGSPEEPVQWPAAEREMLDDSVLVVVRKFDDRRHR